MALKKLPKKVHLDIAIEEFGLTDMPISRALNVLLQYSQHDQLPIYFDDSVLAVKDSVEFGEIFDGNDESPTASRLTSLELDNNNTQTSAKSNSLQKGENMFGRRKLCPNMLPMLNTQDDFANIQAAT